MKYRKKPVVIDAILFDASPQAAIDVCEMAGDSERLLTFDERGCVIKTLEGEMLANFGDYIIKGVQGELYPCKPDIFAKTYEPAGESCGGPAHPVGPCDRGVVQEEFERLARPLIDFLNREGNPHTHIILDVNSAEMAEGVRCFKTEDYLRD